MKVHLKFDYTQLTKKILQDKLAELGYKFAILGFGEFDFLESVPDEKIKEITAVFESYGTAPNMYSPR